MSDGALILRIIDLEMGNVRRDISDRIDRLEGEALRAEILSAVDERLSSAVQAIGEQMAQASEAASNAAAAAEAAEAAAEDVEAAVGDAEAAEVADRVDEALPEVVEDALPEALAANDDEEPKRGGGFWTRKIGG